MEEIIKCPIKINLTLRVFDARPDGYHNIYSVFWRKNGPERLTIKPKDGENAKDALRTSGIKIDGENLITKVLRAVRGSGIFVPPLDVALQKCYPAGSGVGAGSGNAAAFLEYLKDKYGAHGIMPEKLGADVAFFASGFELASAGGIGERLNRLAPIRGISWVLGVPSWHSRTKAAYVLLQRYRGQHASVSTEEALSEGERLVAALRDKKNVGLMPNDFTAPLTASRAEYLEAFADAKEAGALGWGLCGSGSAFFALCESADSRKRAVCAYRKKKWITRIFEME